MKLDFAQLLPSIPFILEGLKVTLMIVGAAGILGFLFGIILSLFKISPVKPLVWFADAYTSVFRGTPLVLQLMIIFYGSPQLFGTQIEPYTAAILSFSLNSAAYISEIIRAGINAVDKGQKEAAMALGIPYSQTMKDIILPQAIKNILPALMNEFITLTKESAIVTVIGAMDVMRRSYMVGSDLYSFFEPLLLAGFIYYIMVMVLTLLGKLLERRLKGND
ncbi:arginine ABC transporter permease [[Bacillus] enclensis]|uniref:Polar amino acid transport system permease protein n=2 Tax=Rossellomorea TaxID=2837508 RepID=A0A0V8HM59_9BACI|nr:amino acid ABC transporter permease [[Bacillus] enclensis]QTC43428.1 amino acid ABC transporter permease [Bacillus sp. V3]QWC21599.1 amino acid ABC transporter permease [Bacillus haikouensis]KSU63572.1 arginine ABC transporter permease [[Bacillus] enclensis]MBH9968394.1 amino acid ABC transporter permease [[Bacillus] enclensis]SCB86207.1 polar amino acid transport system permease protein [[Bacillus] enclensis]